MGRLSNFLAFKPGNVIFRRPLGPNSSLGLKLLKICGPILMSSITRNASYISGFFWMASIFCLASITSGLLGKNVMKS